MKQRKARQAIVKKIVKNVECTKDEGDVLNEENTTWFFDRLRRLHIMQYSHRIFTFPGAAQWDAGYKQPQYIGRDESENDYPIKGMFLPVDAEGEEYYMSKRVEWAHPEIIGDISMSKSMPTTAHSPVRWTARSKLGTGLRYVAPPKARPSSSSTSYVDHV